MFSPTVNKVDKLQFQRLVAVRAIAIACQCLAIASAITIFNVHLPLVPVLSIIGFHFTFNLVMWWRVKNTDGMLTDKEFFTHLCVDTVTLAVLLYFTGGSTNPFVSLFLLPVIIVAATLQTRFAAFMALLAVTCYTILMFFYIPLPHSHMGHGTEFDLHVFGMWLSFVIAIGLIIFFVLMMAESIRERDKLLTQARAQGLRDESLVALGTFAAGTAHDLGTPLGTMAITVEDIQTDYPDDPELQQQLGLLVQQIARCKSILTELSTRSGQIRAEGGYKLSLKEYLDKIVTEWQNMRPNTLLEYTWVNADENIPNIIGDQTLRQAISNLLNNAADACKQKIQLKASYQNSRLLLDVIDDGEGIPADYSTLPGTLTESTKPQGMGIGIYLTQAVIDRLGGHFRLNNLSQGGTCAHIDLPLDKLRS